MEPDQIDADADAPVIVADEVDTAPDEVTVEGDTVVTVEVPDDGGDSDAVGAVVVDAALDHAERIASLEARVAAVEEVAFRAEITADIAADMASDAIEADAEIIEATDEAIVETLEDATIEDTDKDGEDEIVVDEIAPVSSRIHPVFRPLSDWRAGR